MKAKVWTIWKYTIGSFSDEKTEEDDNIVAILRTGIVLVNFLTCFFISFRWSQQKELIYISNEKIKLEKGRLIKEKSWEEFRSFAVLEVETDKHNSQKFCFQSKGKRFYFGSFLNEEDKLILKNELTRIISQLNALSPGM